ncbi:helix-turn-helix domain-containing protein [Kitasatospora terrestris]|uniref:HTH tetR-type domain-containing protein n=1 Tax=Kitasatospora terrestris TaxID=258051 RepID=A0ABP9EUZ6_9ACTN
MPVDNPRRSGAGRVGRPRAQARPDSDLSPREEVLAAAAELFTRDGYAATTTRAVAEKAGMRQASLYHWFAGKEDILATLLESTVEPSLGRAADLLAAVETDPAARLWALAAYDAALLHRGLYNLGALYQLPEVRGERFQGFRRARAELKAAYGELLLLLTPGEGDLELRTDLLFGLVEGGVAVARERADRDADRVAGAVAAAALRFAGVPADAAAPAARAGAALLAAPRPAAG